MPLSVFSVKKEYYAIIIMSTYGENDRVSEEKFRTIGGESINFK